MNVYQNIYMFIQVSFYQGGIILEVEIEQFEGATFLAKGESNHWSVMDTSKDNDGSEGGSSPMEMLLMSMGGCTGIDIHSILKKMQIDYNDLKIEISGVRRDEHPRVFKEIEFHYKVFGENISEDKIDRAIDLSHEKYCSAINTVNDDIDIDYSFEIIEE